MNIKRIAYVTGNESIAFSLDGVMQLIPKSHMNYNNLIAVLDSGNIEGVRPLLVSIKQSIADSSDGSIKLGEDNQLYFEGEVLHSSMLTRLISLRRDGLNIRPLLNFQRNILDNPSPRARAELYAFMEVNNLPVTADGYFIAYKMVRADYRDIYTGSMDNSPGCVPKMDRSKVDPDKDKTCSFGLHFAGLHYVRSGYGDSERGDRLMAVKINPRDVVAIPSDYNNSKGRACEYLILRELDWSSTLPVNTVGFNLFDDTAATDDEGDTAADASDGDVLVLTPDGATSHRTSNRLWGEAVVRQAKRLLAEPDASLSETSRVTGMSRRLLARIRDGEAYTDVTI